MRDRLLGAFQRVPVWLRTVGAVLAFAGVATWLTVSTWHGISTSRGDIGLLTDFRDAIYYPLVALRDGIHPSNVEAAYRPGPVGQEFPLYTPIHLLLNQPLLLFSFSTARAVNFGWNLALVIGLAAMSLRLAALRITVASLFGLGTLILVSDPGKFDLRTGQPTLLIVIACYLAFRFVPRPSDAGSSSMVAHASPLLLGAVAVAVVWSKPTFAIPLAVLLVVTGRVRLVAYGTLLGAALSAVMLPALIDAAGSLSRLVTSWQESARITSQSPQSRLGSGLRIDIGNTFVRVTHLHPSEEVAAVGGLLLLLAGAALIGWLHRRNPAGDREELVITFAALLMLTSVYHVPYDYLLLIGPALMLARRRATVPIAWPRRVRTLVLILMLIPLVDPLGWSPINAVLGKSGFQWMLGSTMMSTYVLTALGLCIWAAVRQLQATRVASDVVEV